MILPDPRLLLLLLLTGGIRPGAPSTAHRTAQHRSSEPPPENPSRPNRTTGTSYSSDTTNIHLPSEPNRTDGGFISEPQRTETHSPSEPNGSETYPPSEPNRSEIYPPLEPNRSETYPPSEPNRTETDSPLESRRTETRFPSDPNATKSHSPSEPNRTGTISSEPNRTKTQSPSEPNRTETQSPSEPNRTKTQSPSEPNRTETQSPSEPNRTGTISSEPNRTETQSPSEPNRTETQSPSEPNRTETQSPSEPNRTGTISSEPNRTKTQSPSEPNRTGTDSLLESGKTETHFPSEQNTTGTISSEWKRTETDSPSEPNRTKTHPPSEPNRTGTKSLLESGRTEKHFPSEPNTTGIRSSELKRMETFSPSETNGTDTLSSSEPNRSETHSPSEPNRSENHSPSEPNRTETDSPSEPNRTETDSPSEPNRTQTHYPSEPNRDEAGLLFVEDKEKTQTVAELDQNFYRWDNGGTDPDFTQTDRQTSSASGITQKSVTRRHISKRTPHMDTTSVSTAVTDGGDQTHSSVTNNTDITENPTTSTTDMDSRLINTDRMGSATKDSGNKTSHSSGMTQVSVTRAKDSGNTTQGSVTIIQDAENSTETSGLNKTDPELSASITYPLQTPSYSVTTYPSPTPHQVSESSAPFTSIPVTAPNTTSHVQGTDVPVSESTFASSSTNSSFSTIPASSSEFPSLSPEVFNQSSSDVSSSSPIPSTLVSSPFSTFSTFPSEASPKFTPTKTTAPQTTLLTTPELPTIASLPSVPPSLPTTSSYDDNLGTSTPYRTSIPISRTEQTSGAYNSSTTGLRESYTTGTSQRFLDGTTTELKDIVTTLRSILETQTVVISLEDRGTQSITTTYVTEPPVQPTSHVPLTTIIDILIPPSRFSTQGSPRDIPETTRPGDPRMTTGDSSKQVTTIRTTSMDIKTVMPNVGTTTSSKEKKMPAYTTAQPGVITVKHSTTTTATSPPNPTAPSSPTLPAPVSVCSPNPCHNGGSCIQHGGHHKSYRCECPAAWQGHHCETDVDECLSNPCPAQAMCMNRRGSFICRCPLGYIMEKEPSCVQVRTFLGHIQIPRSFLNGSNGKFTKLQQIEEQIVHILNSSFSAIAGYYQSSVTNSSFSNRIELSVQNIFLLSSNVTLSDLRHNIQRYKKGCLSNPQHSAACQLILHSELYYIAVSLCNMKNPGCDNETAECTDPAGIAQCQCKVGYFKYSVTDRACRACDDGYKLQDGACVRCPFGLGGFNCSNPYQLITVIISAAGGGLLLILGVALAVTCCRKSKHDISKLIFKSGDFQMSPYAEYPKAQRSNEWGRETIEMQENGSTKNLLQMTDVYYSPGLRNSELERNGLCPYSGLPGSRHSCIYPGQYNPTFITEENRRRDYF
ncbi:LOW QUALITY PROTEIN: protein HEG homolog 1 [Mantella aurantiaca]